MEYPNWSITDYFRGFMSFVGYSVSQQGDFWMKLAGFFMAVLLGAGLIPASILWFIIKNKGRVGGMTWVLMIIVPIIGFIWLALA